MADLKKKGETLQQKSLRVNVDRFTRVLSVQNVFNGSQVRHAHVKNHSASRLLNVSFNEVNIVKEEETVYICLSRLLNYFKEI